MGKRANGEGSITRRKDGRWEGAGTALVAGGGRKRVRFYGTSREEAQAKLLAALEQARRNIPAPNTAWSVGSYLDYWLRTVVPIKTRPRTLELYEATVRLHITPYIGTRPLAKLSVQDVQGLANRLQDDGHSRRTLHRMRTVLSSALGRAEKEELVYRNVARLIDLPQYERKSISPWTADQARTFLAASQGHRWEIGYRLLLTYGMRRGEALGLRWSDIDFETDVIHVHQQLQRIGGLLTTGPVKTSAGKRSLPLLPHLRQMLVDLREHSIQGSEGLILLSVSGTPVDPKTFVSAFQQIARSANLPRITVHHTRHTAATLLKNAGVPVRDVQLILGHSNITTTQEIYQHGDVSGQRKALEQVAEMFAEDATTVATAVPSSETEAERCRQPLPSNNSKNMNLDASQDKKNRRSTGVDAAAFLGGPAGTRTPDTLLKSLIYDTVADLPTSVITALHSRSRCRTVGCVAVNVAVKTSSRTQDTDPLAHRPNVDALSHAREWNSLRRACRTAMTTKLRKASFPLSLLSVSPLPLDKEIRP
ncbi:site-specific integrase [Microbacterium sp.]|uniref:tyrosine-type recombinase/integrase n=1 Tax=Microbacterium sp. TaxID=51671 RepID=UPI0025F3114C|nr:site-specific integrase [Microbacterium sp.]MBT9605903.1 site-specific integrase [Microbacterium sp.]